MEIFSADLEGGRLRRVDQENGGHAQLVGCSANGLG